MGALTGKRIEVKRQCGDQGFTLTGFHLRYLAVMQDDPAQQLDIVMAKPDGAFGGFANCSKGLREKIFEGGFFELVLVFVFRTLLTRHQVPGG